MPNIPTDELVEDYIFYSTLLYRDKCDLDAMKYKRDALDRAIEDQEIDIALQQRHADDCAFDLMLRLPCHQFAKIINLLDF